MGIRTHPITRVISSYVFHFLYAPRCFHAFLQSPYLGRTRILFWDEISQSCGAFSLDFNRESCRLIVNRIFTVTTSTIYRFEEVGTLNGLACSRHGAEGMCGEIGRPERTF